MRREKSGLPLNSRHPATSRVTSLAENIAIGRVGPDLALGNSVPEQAKLLETAVRRIPGDDRGIDSTDRDAGQPVRLDAASSITGSILPIDGGWTAH